MKCYCHSNGLTLNFLCGIGTLFTIQSNLCLSMDLALEIANIKVYYSITVNIFSMRVLVFLIHMYIRSLLNYFIKTSRIASKFELTLKLPMFM